MIYKEIDNGKEKWIVLVHCVCGNERIFLKQMRTLKKTHNIAMIRLPGHYEGSNINEVSFKYIIDEIYNFALSKKNKIDIMGVSLGAMITAKYIIEHEDTIDNAYLIGTIFGFSSSLLNIGYSLLLKINRLIPKSLYMYFITKIILPGKTQKFQRNKLYATSRKINKDFLYLWMKEMEIFIKNGNENFIKILNSKANVILIYGSKDTIFLNWVTKRIKKENSKKLKIIKDCGHLCNIEQCSKINAIIKKDNTIA